MGCVFIESFDRIRVQCYSKSTPILIAAEAVITVMIHYHLLHCLLFLVTPVINVVNDITMITITTGGAHVVHSISKRP